MCSYSAGMITVVATIGCVLLVQKVWKMHKERRARKG